MKILLDTHTLLWFIEGDPRLSERSRQLIENTLNEVTVSTISLFEIAIKLKIGKLSLRKSLPGLLQDIEDAYIKILQIDPLHLSEYQRIPLLADHRDPFDRLIVATAVTEGAVLVTRDPKLADYRDLVELVW